ncbi:hypothetical protein ACFL0D_02910 [Thermoproteota archaeon]
MTLNELTELTLEYIEQLFSEGYLTNSMINKYSEISLIPVMERLYRARQDVAKFSGLTLFCNM